MISLHHIELNVTDLKRSRSFYSKLAKFVTGRLIDESEDSFSWRLGSFYLWFNQVQQRFSDVPYHRKRVGLDHVALRLSSKEEILKLRELLVQANIPILYDADFYGPDYFALYIEDPDRIKLEFGADTRQV